MNVRFLLCTLVALAGFVAGPPIPRAAGSQAQSPAPSGPTAAKPDTAHS